ncbi:GNAT family N-acetyltransferase [Candidatus Bipolaricaulota bacterium]|nr:GNAT family N-acetyltransferase [Candidatus Bipolaricaulota bacterium]
MRIDHKQKHFELSAQRLEQVRRQHPDAIVEEEDALVVLDFESEASHVLHWSADSPQALVSTVQKMQQQMPLIAPWHVTLVNQGDYAKALLSLGFTVRNHYLDHWLGELSGFSGLHATSFAMAEAQLADAVRLAHVSQACGGDIGWQPSTSAWYADWLEDSASAVLIAEASGQLAGFCCVRSYGEQNNRVWIRELAVRPNDRRLGLGRGLLEAGLLWGQRQGAVKAFLAVDARSAEARRLYERIGFLPNGEEEYHLILAS